MRDVVYVAITIGFFGVAAQFVRGCARIVGPDGPGLDPGHPDDEPAGHEPARQEAAAGSVRS